MSEERRQFQRITMARPVACLQHAQQHPATLLDISLRGALLAIEDDWRPELNSEIEYRIDMTGDGQYEISASASVRHVVDGQLGLETTRMDIDSASCLRRLVELNLGDPDLLERELRHLLNTAN